MQGDSGNVMPTDFSSHAKTLPPLHPPRPLMNAWLGQNVLHSSSRTLCSDFETPFPFPITGSCTILFAAGKRPQASQTRSHGGAQATQPSVTHRVVSITWKSL